MPEEKCTLRECIFSNWAPCGTLKTTKNGPRGLSFDFRRAKVGPGAPFEDKDEWIVQWSGK